MNLKQFLFYYISVSAIVTANQYDAIVCVEPGLEPEVGSDAQLAAEPDAQPEAIRKWRLETFNLNRRLIAQLLNIIENHPLLDKVRKCNDRYGHVYIIPFALGDCMYLDMRCQKLIFESQNATHKWCDLTKTQRDNFCTRTNEYLNVKIHKLTHQEHFTCYMLLKYWAFLPSTGERLQFQSNTERWERVISEQWDRGAQDFISQTDNNPINVRSHDLYDHLYD